MERGNNPRASLAFTMAKKKTFDPDTIIVDEAASVPEAPPTPVTLLFRGLGYKRDEIDVRDFPALKLLGAPRNLPQEASLESLIRRIRDQGQTSSCVGQSTSSAAEIRLDKMGVKHENVSADGMYKLARSWGRSSANEGLVDEGAFIRNAFKGTRESGLISERVCPFDPTHINDELTWDQLQAASTYRVKEWYKLSDDPSARISQICSAISQGFPVVYGIDLDNAFMDHTGSKVLGQLGKNRIGGHAMCLVGYRTVNGQIQIRGLNSWGTTWGDNGLYWCDQNFICDESANDFCVMQIGPKGA